MKDFELLQMAAKAAGLEIIGTIEGLEGFSVYEEESQNSGNIHHWNPLQRDDDAFRLMVKLRMWEDCDDGICCVEKTEDHGGDVYAATRRAIVRGAAEFGKAKQLIEERP